MKLGFRPTALRVDPDQDVFRRLDPREIPPILSRLLGDPRTLFVVDDGAGEEIVTAYREMAKTLTRTGEGEIVDASRATPEALGGRSVFLLGAPRGGPLAELLAGLPEEVRVAGDRFVVQGTEFAEPGASLLVVARHPGDPARAIALFHGHSAGAVSAAGRKLVHYGKYSFLAFVDGTNRAKGVARATDGPLVHRFPAAASP
jgi:hypothetical protein